ncbi:MAG: glutamyl-tRNA reductase [Actinomycetota bacterium]
MPLLTVGISYRRASVAMLERVAFAAEDLPKAYHHLSTIEAVRGAAVLSTCNRTEVVAEVESYHAGLQALRRFLGESREIPLGELDAVLDSHYEDESVRRLFAVASGIDSMVVGEPQIQAQVRDALRHAEDERGTSSLVGAAFRRAVRVGRRARSETRIGASPSAFVEAGATLGVRSLGSLDGRALLVVGAGPMADLAVRAFAERGMADVTVLNRTSERAERLARRAGGSAGSLDELDSALRAADVVVSVTGATGLVIGRAPVERASAARAGRPLFVLDLAVPRDVDPSVSELPGVTLADIDALRDVVGRADRAEILAVEAIVEDEVRRFAEWRRAARLAPMLRELYDRAERVRRAELDRVDARLSALTEEERAAVDAATAAIVKKLLHRPVVRAKGLAEDDADVRALARLFGLEPPPPA